MNEAGAEAASQSRVAARPDGLSGRQTALILAVIMAVAALLRLAFLLRAGVDGELLVEPDSPSYLGPAEALLRDGRFSIAPSSDEPMWLRTPGYPVFLAALMAVVGTSPFAVGVAQAGVLLVLIPLVYWLGAILVNRTVGLVAAAVCALDPLVSYHSAVLLTEGLTAVVLTALAIAVVKAVRSDSVLPWWWLAVGMLLVASTMVRPTTYYLGAIVAVAAPVWVAVRSRRLMSAVGVFGAVAIPQLLAIGAWRWRNSSLFGSSRFSSIEAVNMLFYRGAGVVARRERLTFAEAQTRLGEQLGSPADFATQGEYVEAMYSQGAEIILSYPFDYLVVAIRGLVWSMFGPGREPLTMLLGETLARPAALVNLVLIGVSWVLIGVFLWSLRRSWRVWSSVAWVAALPLYLLVISAGPESYGRFRAPVIPILLVFAVAGGAEIWTWWSGRHRRVVAMGVTDG